MYDINSGYTGMIKRGRQCRVPTQNNIVGTRHCRLLILAANNSDAAGFDMKRERRIIHLIHRGLRIGGN